MPDDKFKWDSEKGTVTLVKGDATKTFDLNKDDDRTSFMKLSQRGWYYDEDASKELGELRNVIQNWDNAIKAASESDEGMRALTTKLEAATGRRFSKQETQQIVKEESPRILLDDDENEKLVGTISKLEREIANLKKQQDDYRKSIEEKELEREQSNILEEAKSLEKKYDGKNNSPKFDKDEVIAFAVEKQISDLELAFKMMNFDKLTEHAKKIAVKEYNEEKLKLSQDRFNVTKQDIPPDLDLHKKVRAKNYHQMAPEVAKTAKEEGLNFFTDD